MRAYFDISTRIVFDHSKPACQSFPMKLTFAFCTYNRAPRLERLVAEMRSQESPIPFEILAVNNNSTDKTLSVLEALAKLPGVPLRVVTEESQGIVPARNRALEESLTSDILVFIDDDELPKPGILKAACDAILNEGAECAGGKVEVDFAEHRRPRWLGDELLGFLAEVDHGDDSRWIKDESTPLWTANIAYDMKLFRNRPNLRFDGRYNRAGGDIGGGEDVIMFRTLVARGARIRYRPDMQVLHAIEPWRLSRRYFVRLHYKAGVRRGRYQLPAFPRAVFGIPPFLVSQFLRQGLRALLMNMAGQVGAIRQAMTAANTLGSIVGYRQRRT